MKKLNEVLLSDLFVFNLKNHIFLEVEVEDKTLLSWYGFLMNESNDDIILFGGLCDRNFINGEILKINIDKAILSGLNLNLL